MSREEDDRAADDYLDNLESEYNNAGHTLSPLFTQAYKIGHSHGIAYGRATPDREMLKRFAEHIYNYMSVYLTAPDGENVTIDEFLTLENQRGKNER